KEYEDSVRAIRERIVEAVREGRLPGDRLEEAAVRVAGLKRWLESAGAAEGDRAIGQDAARRAGRVTGTAAVSRNAVVLEVRSRSNIAVGPVPWGLGPWTPDAVQVDADTAEAGPLVAHAAGRPLVIVVRDAHVQPAHRALVTELLASRPDAVLVEMGLPVW